MLLACHTNFEQHQFQNCNGNWSDVDMKSFFVRNRSDQQKIVVLEILDLLSCVAIMFPFEISRAVSIMSHHQYYQWHHYHHHHVVMIIIITIFIITFTVNIVNITSSFNIGSRALWGPPCILGIARHSTQMPLISLFHCIVSIICNVLTSIIVKVLVYQDIVINKCDVRA